MRHTLIEFIEFYQPETVQLVYGAHSIHIDLNLAGSCALVRTFEREKFYFKSCNDKNLILSYAM